MKLALLGSIPSPQSATVHVGPLALHIYGLCIAAGALAAVWLASRRWVERGGDNDDISSLAIWTIPAGIVGARLYHVITDSELYRNEPWRALYIWDGGLGIWGGIAAGVIAGAYFARRRGHQFPALLDTVAPALALSQSIGRWGNYFNQELFGRPTSLPWAIEIDPFNRPGEYATSTSFHPTFLYESLWTAALCVGLIAIERRFRLRPGSLFLIYVAGYTLVRFFIELIRVDFAHEIVGLRFNAWMSLAAFSAAVIALIYRSRRPYSSTSTTPEEISRSR